ncbi:uncharacterized protein LOC127902381 [Citrus sinensis]|uniref:uncharacterized protein LOC127902381 n=1 Tax=Citrus sinensis TaxID=2711 RepID=UPI00227947DD|nr:uncharacterized protein LOC127902381 [Citrus sinensis]
MGDVLFSLLIDKSRIISAEEQMAVVLRYVDKNGYAVERFIGIEHVTSTTSISLKEALDRLFSRHGLSMFRLRGQGYDGASNMQAKCRDILQVKHAQAIIKALDDGELSSGRGFDKQKLLRLTEFYPNDFFLVDLVALETQLDVYIMDVSSDKNFSGIKGIVATTTVERAFSDMNFVKNRLRNWMRDQ